MQSEGEKLTELVEKEKAQIDSIFQIIAVINKLEERHNNETWSWSRGLSRSFSRSSCGVPDLPELVLLTATSGQAGELAVH